MNKLQTIFSAITGFEASHIPAGSEAEGWQDWDADTLVVVAENLDLPSIDSEEAEVLHSALTKFRECDTGQGVDLDVIYSSLGA